jgi:hypothetical protein
MQYIFCMSERTEQQAISGYLQSIEGELASSSPRPEVISTDVLRLRASLNALGFHPEGGTADSLEDVRQLVQAVRVTLEHMGEPMALSQREMEMRKIAKLRESREISPHDMDLNFLWQLNQSDRPLTRQHLAHETGNQAVILTKEDFDALGCIDFIHSSGERMIIDSDCLPEGNIFVLYPEDLGDEEGKPFCK